MRTSYGLAFGNDYVRACASMCLCVNENVESACVCVCGGGGGGGGALMCLCLFVSATACASLLIHWSRDKMAAIFQTTFSNAFSWMKMYKFRLRYHWTLFSRVQLAIYQHWFRWWLGKPLYEPMKVIQLTHRCVIRPQWVKIIYWMQQHDSSIYYGRSCRELPLHVKIKWNYLAWAFGTRIDWYMTT